jgi:hypothetical protein
LLLAASGVAQAQESPTTLHGGWAEPQAQVGDAERVEVRSEWRSTSVQTLEGDAEGFRLERKVSLRASFRRRVLEVDAEGAAAFELVFDRWSWTSGETTHEDLADARVILRRGPRGFVPVRAEPAEDEGADERSSPAQRFLDREARRLTTPLLGVLVPDRALTLGVSWEVPPAELAPFLVEDTRLGVDGAEVNCKLLGLGTEPNLRARVTLPLKSLPGTDVRAEPGTRLGLLLEVEWPRGGARRNASVRRTERWEATGRSRRPDGRGYRLKVRVASRVRRKVRPVSAGDGD